MDEGVIGVLVFDKEGGLDLAAVGVFQPVVLAAAPRYVHILKGPLDLLGDCAVKGEHDHHGSFVAFQTARNPLPIFGAIAVRKMALIRQAMQWLPKLGSLGDGGLANAGADGRRCRIAAAVIFVTEN